MTKRELVEMLNECADDEDQVIVVVGDEDHHIDTVFRVNMFQKKVFLEATRV